MKKLLLLLILVFPSLAFGETFYVTQSGTGNGSSYAAAMSIANFNNASYWDTDVADDGKIGPGDTVYLCDTITTQVRPGGNGSVGNEVIVRGDYTDHILALNVVNQWTTTWIHSIDLASKSYFHFYNATTRAVIDGQVEVGASCTDDDCKTNPPASVGSSVNGGVNSSTMIAIENSHYITFENWEIRNGVRAFYGYTSGSYFTLRKSYIHTMGQDGIRMADYDYILIGGSAEDANEFYRTGFKSTTTLNAEGGAIQLSGVCDHVVISYNEIHGTTDKYYDGWLQGGLMLYGVNYAVAEYNTIHDFGAAGQRSAVHLKSQNQWAGFRIIVRFNNMYNGVKDDNWGYSDHAGITSNRNLNSVMIYGNRIHNFNSGMELGNADADSSECRDGIDTRNIYIWGNLISNQEFYGLRLYQGASACTDDVHNIFMINNSIWHTSDFIENSVSFPNYTAMNIQLTPESIDDEFHADPIATIKNNIFSTGRHEQTYHHQIQINYDNIGSGTDYLDIDYNLWYDPADSAGDFNVVFPYESFCATAATSCSYTNENIPAAWFANAVVGDPLFTATATGDLTLGVGSPAINAGDDISALTIPDIVGLDFYAAKTGGNSTQEFSFYYILDPATTDWSTTPPTVGLIWNGTSPEIGAYYYPPGGADSTNPVANITTVDPQNISADMLSVSFTCTDANGINTAKWRIGAAPDATYGTVVTGISPFTASVSGFSEGSNLLYVACADPTGNYGSDSITVNLNSAYPPIEGDGTVINGISHAIVNGACRSRNGIGLTYSTATALTPSPASWSPSCDEGDADRTQAVVFTAAGGTVTFGAGAAALTTGTVFAIDSDGCSSQEVTTGDDCTVTLSMDCTTAATPTDTLTVTSDADDSPKTVALSGTISAVAACNETPYRTVANSGTLGTAMGDSYLRQFVGLRVNAEQVTADVCEVDIHIEKYAGDISGKTYYLSIYNLDGAGNLSGAATASSAGITGDNDWVFETPTTFTFSPAVSLAPGQVLVLRKNNTSGDASNYVRLHYIASDSDSGYSYHAWWRDNGALIGSLATSDVIGDIHAYE